MLTKTRLVPTVKGDAFTWELGLRTRNDHGPDKLADGSKARLSAVAAIGSDGGTSPGRWTNTSITSRRRDRPARRQSTHSRSLHTRARHAQQATTVQQVLDAPGGVPPGLPSLDLNRPGGIREKLRQWQETEGKQIEHTFEPKLAVEETIKDEFSNITRIGDAIENDSTGREEDDELQSMGEFARSATEDLDVQATDPRAFSMGDLVELFSMGSEKESTIAVYVRTLAQGRAQFYTMQGRWVILPSSVAQYTIPGWVSRKAVAPLLKYLPDVVTSEEIEALKQQSFSEDLSVPRHIAAPLINRMVEFHNQSLDVYRKHAPALDNAHNILAHETDLRYGSLDSAANVLLQKSDDRHSLATLFTVRKALLHAGFAFGFHMRSHRTTQYLQIRSKAQVRMVEEVRGWLRAWQDDLAITSTTSEGGPERKPGHRTSGEAKRVHSFVKKCRELVIKSRETRDVTAFGNIGPSKVKIELTPTQDSINIIKGTEFNSDDKKLVQFIEAWACNDMFAGLPRLSALPPLIMQATGLYDDIGGGKSTGFQFLQEIGLLLPFENRVRFDEHLLLPTSQHSRPLQYLMSSLMDMESKPDFEDSMKHLRHDWGSLPVYCIDGASAHEIDDGLSVERANSADSASPEWWAHIHIANPTAYLPRDHPMSKMARHMGESVYMPERAYMMLPRWATQGHFSLAPNRPCLTFSARLNGRGEIIEQKIRSGLIRNVTRLTPSEVTQIVGLNRDQGEEVVLTVGGTPPPAPERISPVSNMKPQDVENLKALQILAERRATFRNAAGGLFFNVQKPEVAVWQSYNKTGLGWDHPYRNGSRIVHGDPIIQATTSPLRNWFSAAQNTSADILVREMMLLACEISTAWCAERQIPTIYRGSVAKADLMPAEEFYETTVAPAMALNDGQMPLHIALDYLRHVGSIVLTTKPLKHRLLGLNYYGKVTSPLRRYGDMILHWQIEAALREEARTDTSLVTTDRNASRSFLPFSESVLKTIILGLQPRESLVSRAKASAEQFWINMLLFRAHHYGETELPQTLRCYVPQAGWAGFSMTVVAEELNLDFKMARPERGSVVVMVGDVWECRLLRMTKLSPKGHERHDLLFETAKKSALGLKKSFSQQDLMSLWDITDAAQLMIAVQELIQHSLLRTLRADRILYWSPRPWEVASALSNFDNDERLIYEAVENAEATGIWIKRLKQNTGVAPQNVPKIVKKLESSRLIKNIKSVKSIAQKTYICFHIEPADDVTGGSFFDAGDLDESLVEELSNLIVFHVRGQSWVDVKRKSRREAPIDVDEEEGEERSGQKRRAGSGDIEDAAPKKRRRSEPEVTQVAYPAGSRGYPTAESIHNFVTNSNAIRPTKAASLTVQEVQGILKVLVWDGKLEKVGAGYRTCLGVSYKVPGSYDFDDREGEVGNGLTEAPCGRCPVFDLCAEGGPVNAGNCVYFDQWLKA
ncbi:hypothetical protein B0A48_00271 [Cryoendolithus antarcticus]|uniref:RNB domain-containing protein n=1 Tax=Cryoendolithus antarcticus TaxID=1507870 RepID=A0A1V8TU76_9PEZI|nr:hypothetical protein B0A48_00271 [Cryoendolithus antarcticus]